MWLLLLMILPEHIRNRRSVKVAAFLVVVGTLVFWYYNFPFQKVHDYILQSQRGKSILLWNGNEMFFKQPSDCGSLRCEMVSNRSERPIESYDAIVVIFDDKFAPIDPMELIEFQSESNNTNQKFVFYTRKSLTSLLASYQNLSEFAGVFNWTMTYRRDSDIPLLYGRIVPEEFTFFSPEDVQRHIERARQSFRSVRSSPSIPKDNKDQAIVAWMVSDDCDTTSQRELYVKELRNYIEVDVYGGCGNLTGSYDILLQSNYYKFYLSFENSICPDYVTETFFKTMDRNVVPIVYGGADYTQYAPIHSYIDAGQFRPEELASYLKILDANDTLYGEYFWWKDHYRVMYSADNMWRDSYCDLCQKLHRDFESKSYQDLISHWSDNNQCT